LYSEDPHYLNPSPDITMNKSTRMTCPQQILFIKHKGKRPIQSHGLSGRIILKLILKKQYVCESAKLILWIKAEATAGSL
jgi:hypothetical protein